MQRVFAFVAALQYNFVLSVKILVVVKGNHRGGEEAWSSLHRHLLEPYNADLATFRDCSDTRPLTMLHQKSKYIFAMHEYNDWSDYFVDNAGEFANIIQHHKDKGIIGNKARQPWKISNTNQLAYHHAIIVQLKRLNLTSIYDWFVFTRSDHFYLCRHINVFDNNKNKIFIPSGEDYGGITDRHIICSNKLAENCIDTPSMILKNMNFLRPSNLEKLTYWHLDKLNYLKNVVRFNRTFFLIQAKNDTLRWGHPRKLIGPDGTTNLNLKYFSEFIMTKKNCKSIFFSVV